jgi:hypothetical protein
MNSGYSFKLCPFFEKIRLSRLAVPLLPGPQRQAAYRKNRATAGDNGERRINVWVSTATALALQRLARRGAVTQRSVIEELVLAADEQAAAGLTEEEWAEYFSVTR